MNKRSDAVLSYKTLMQYIQRCMLFGISEIKVKLPLNFQTLAFIKGYV